MSKTPWPAGLRPVMNVGHAHHECDGTVDRQSPCAPRSIRACRLGSSPASSMGRRIFQSTPSQPMIRTLLGIAGAGYQLQGGGTGMRAWEVERPGPVDSAPLAFVERDVPEPGPGEVRVE